MRVIANHKPSFTRCGGSTPPLSAMQGEVMNDMDRALINNLKCNFDEIVENYRVVVRNEDGELVVAGIPYENIIDNILTTSSLRASFNHFMRGQTVSIDKKGGRLVYTHDFENFLHRGTLFWD